MIEQELDSCRRLATIRLNVELDCLRDAHVVYCQRLGTTTADATSSWAQLVASIRLVREEEIEEDLAELKEKMEEAFGEMGPPDTCSGVPPDRAGPGGGGTGGGGGGVGGSGGGMGTLTA